MVEIHVSPTQVWDLFSKIKGRLATEQVVIAEDKSAKIAIYITEDKGFPLFISEADGTEEYREGSVSALDAEDTYARMLEETFDGTNILTENDLPAEDIDRLDDIRGATEDLLQVFLEEDPAFQGFVLDDLDRFVDLIEELLYTTYGYTIRRPAMLHAMGEAKAKRIEYRYDDDVGGSLGVPEYDMEEK